MEIESISKNKKRINPAGNRKAPIVLNVGDSIMPSEETLQSLDKIASHSSVCSHVVGLTDIHSKPKNDFPTGTAIVTEDKVVPQFTDAGLNCGMRMMKTPLFAEDLSDSLVTRIFEELQKNIALSAKGNQVLSVKDFLGICKRGSHYIIEKYGLDPEETQYIENSGNMFAEDEINDEKIRACIPSSFIKLSRPRFGTLGKNNNHFIEMQRVDKIVDEELARQLGVKPNQIIMLMHTGSSALGALISHFYGPRKMIVPWACSMFVERLRFFKNRSLGEKLSEFKRLYQILFNKRTIKALAETSEEGILFLRGIKIAHNFGYASRTYLMKQIGQSFAKVLDSENFKISLLYDMSHISIFKEEHFGKKVWVHRHGASRAFSSERLNGQSVFSKTGEPVFVPGSMGAATYLGVGHPENHESYFTASHGAGATNDKSSKITNDKNVLIEKMKQRNVKLFKEGSQGIKRIDPDRFKDVELVMNAMVDNKLVQPVARLLPIAVMKG